jgi:hypothetical protein
MSEQLHRLTHLVRDALAGDADAALMLAKDYPGEGFLPFLARFVKPADMTVATFDLFSDAYHRMELERLEESVQV